MQKCEFDVNLINEVKCRPILWDIRMEEYKESDKKPPMWLEIADKLGASVGEEMSLLVILVITRTNVKVHNNMPSLLK
jgi:hypothetical protein